MFYRWAIDYYEEPDSENIVVGEIEAKSQGLLAYKLY